jgi:hypothetical protein
MSAAVKEQILVQLVDPSEDQQCRVLDFARSLAASPNGVAGRTVLHLAGAIEKEDLHTLSRVIEENCEKIDSNEAQGSHRHEPRQGPVCPR